MAASDAQRTLCHAAALRGKRRLLPTTAESGGGADVPGALRRRGPGGPEYPDRAQSPAGGPHYQ